MVDDEGSLPGRVTASGPRIAHQRATNCKRQGELSELAFVYKAASLGFIVARPYGDNERYDFVVDSGQRLWRVQVKSTSYLRHECYRVLVLRHLRGHTVSYQPSEVDFLAAHVIPEEAWFVLPIRAIGSRPVLTLARSPSARRRPRLWDTYREAWHLFREDGVTEQGLPCL
jgi:PD-(D/E)XK endonuclease